MKLRSNTPIRRWNQKMHNFNEPLTEGLKEQELRDLVHNEIHIDEFQAKMGNDSDIIVLSFKIKYKAAAQDFEKFLEKGYNFVLDAETSKSEYANGWYLVFVEIRRRLGFTTQLLRVLSDLKNITNVTNWRFTYGASKKRNTNVWPITGQNLNKIVPLSPKRYREVYAQEKEHQSDLDSLLMASNVNLNKNLEITESDINMRISAGLPVSKYINKSGRNYR